MQRIKTIILGAILLILFLSISLWILTKTLSTNVLKEIVNRELANLTTEATHIDGAITWRIFPTLGIKVTSLHIGDSINPLNGGIFIEDLLLNPKLKPLLHGQFVFRSIKINGLNLVIHAKQTPIIPFKKINESVTFVEKPGRFQFDINRLIVKNATINLLHQQENITLTQFDLDTRDINFKNNAFSLAIKTNVEGTFQGSHLKGLLSYEGNIKLPPSILNAPLLVALQQATIEEPLFADNLEFNQFKFEHISAMAEFRQGALVLSPLTLSLYGGKSEGDLSYQFASGTLSINQTARNINANALFNTMFNKKLIKGNLDADIHASTNLNNTNWKNNFTGKGRLTIKDGILYFIDLQKLVNDASDKIHNIHNQTNEAIKHELEEPIIQSTDNVKGHTHFELLSIQYRFLDRKIMNDAFLLQTNNLELKGQAQVNLADDSLHGHLSATLVTADNMLDKLQQLLGGSFPLTISGKLTAPDISPNLRAINPVISRYMLQNILGIPFTQVKDLLQGILTIPDLLFSNQN